MGIESSNNYENQQVENSAYSKTYEKKRFIEDYSDLTNIIYKEHSNNSRFDKKVNKNIGYIIKSKSLPDNFSNHDIEEYAELLTKIKEYGEESITEKELERFQILEFKRRGRLDKNFSGENGKKYDEILFKLEEHGKRSLEKEELKTFYKVAGIFRYRLPGKNGSGGGYEEPHFVRTEL